MKNYKTIKIKNGNRLVNFYIFECSLCNEEIPENLGITELPDDYLCNDCIRRLFFEEHDLYSLPFMEETKGLLKYTMKARGKRRSLPRDLREKVFRRSEYICQGCCVKDKRLLTVDHKHPYSRGGADVMS